MPHLQEQGTGQELLPGIFKSDHLFGLTFFNSQGKIPGFGIIGGLPRACIK